MVGDVLEEVSSVHGGSLHVTQLGREGKGGGKEGGREGREGGRWLIGNQTVKMGVAI